MPQLRGQHGLLVAPVDELDHRVLVAHRNEPRPVQLGLVLSRTHIPRHQILQTNELQLLLPDQHLGHVIQLLGHRRRLHVHGLAVLAPAHFSTEFTILLLQQVPACEVP